ncbi:MAG: serine/threonine-protein kinase [Rubripirellula sp.]
MLPRDRDDDHATFLPEEDPRSAGTTSDDGSNETFLPEGDTLASFSGAVAPRPRSNLRYDMLVRGDQIGEFRVQRLLGRGSFGAVYLARELTLDRLIALKVVLPSGQHATEGEGRSLARLRHDNIVGVFGEARDPVSQCSLLWMQFVDGFNLENVIRRLRKEGLDCTEANLLRLLTADVPESDSQKKQRPGTTKGSIETICWIGRQLAEAVSHAHACGITHRDIKPANILVDREGRPYLADFNLADDSASDSSRHSGGTIAYMPPEQLAEILGEKGDYDACRADVYSLGVVLWELATGERPYGARESELESKGVQLLRDMLSVRQQERDLSDAEIPTGLALVLQRALHVEPSQRYPSAQALATVLSGLVDLQTARRRAPVLAGWQQFIRRNLFWFLLIGGLLPNIGASFLQSSYNLIWIDPGPAFMNAFLAYNLVVYPACVGWFAWNLYRSAKPYKQVANRVPIRRSEMRRLRRRMLKLPAQYAIASAVGWLPGILLFPWLLGVFGESQSADTWFHYGISFMIAGLIATTYSYAIVLYFVVCHGYRACWQTATHYKERAREELRGFEKRIRLASFLVGVIPLAAAVLLLVIGTPTMESAGLVPTELDPISPAELLKRAGESNSRLASLQRLVIALIIFGAMGLYLVEVASARLIAVVRGLTLADH